MADHAMLDLDDDTTPEARYTDDGTGTWAVSGGPERPLRWCGLAGVEHTGPGDVDADGAADRLSDTDRDGLADRAIIGDTGYVDSDGDGQWDLRLTDSDGDGAADAAGPP